MTTRITGGKDKAYAPLLEEKKKAYSEYRQSKAEMRELLTAKNNVDRLLSITDSRAERETERTGHDQDTQARYR